MEAIWWLHLILGCLDILWSWIGRSSYYSEKVFKMVSEVKKKAKIIIIIIPKKWEI